MKQIEFYLLSPLSIDEVERRYINSILEDVDAEWDLWGPFNDIELCLIIAKER